MGTRREVSWVFGPYTHNRYWRDDNDRSTEANEESHRTAVAHSERRPVTPIQALMECAPGVEPQRCLQELAPLRDLIDDAINATLDERERWVFDGLFCRRMSQRKLGEELSLSKTQVVRIRDAAIEKLQTALVAHQAVKEYLSW